MIHNPRAFTAGAVFCLIAVLFLIKAWPLAPGTVARMGLGFFPRMLGIALTVLGLIIMLGALSPRAPRQPLERWNLRGLILITGAIILFAALIEVAGFVIACTVMLGTASLASREFTPMGRTVCIAVLVVMGLLAFGWGLRLPFPLLPPV